MTSFWEILIPAYLVGGILYALQNMRSHLFQIAARNLKSHGLSWTAIPMILISAALWPLWMASGYLVKWWILRANKPGKNDD